MLVRVMRGFESYEGFLMLLRNYVGYKGLYWLVKVFEFL